MGARPEVVGEYRLLAKLGEGGMGYVVRGEHVRTGRAVAVKFLRRDAARDDASRQRFLREGLVLKSLSHPGLVQLLDWQLEDSQPYLVFDLIEGQGLDAVVARGTLDLVVALVVVEEIARATGKLHEQGIVHRDLKPANVMLRTDGTVCVLDLGLAKHFGDTARTIDRITEAGLTMGTIRYMAPEAVLNPELISSSADIWSLGVMLYELVAGRRPLADAEAQGVVQILEALRTGAFPPLSQVRSDLPRAIDTLLKRFLDPDRTRRIQSGTEAADAVSEFIAAVGDHGEARRKLQTFEFRAPARPRDGVPRAPSSGRSGGGKINQLSGRVAALRVVSPPIWTPLPAFLVVVALLAAGIARTLVAYRTPPVPTVTSTGSSPVESASARVRSEAAALMRVLGSQQHNLDEGWLGRFARARRTSLQSQPDGVAEELRGHLDRIGVGAPLERFLGSSGSYFDDPTIPEAERRAVRSGLCDLEVLECFCRLYAVRWPFSRSAIGLAGAWDRDVQPEKLPLATARSWVRAPKGKNESYFPGATIRETLSADMPRPGERACLWFATMRWRPGLLLDVRVANRYRMILAPSVGVDLKQIDCFAVEYAIFGETKRNTTVNVLGGAQRDRGRGYTGRWLWPDLVGEKIDVHLRMIDLPYSGVGLKDPELIDRVVSVVHQ